MLKKLIHLVIVLFVFFDIPVNAQTKQDTIFFLQKIGTLYLTKMYTEKKFDSAYKMWDNEMFLNLQLYIDPKSKGVIKDSAHLIKKVKFNIAKYYKLIDNFKILEFTEKIIDPKYPKMYMLNYSYSAVFDKKSQQNNSMLIFYFNKKNNSWSISDSRLVIIITRFVQKYKWKKLL